MAAWCSGLHIYFKSKRSLVWSQETFGGCVVCNSTSAKTNNQNDLLKKWDILKVAWFKTHWSGGLKIHAYMLFQHVTSGEHLCSHDHRSNNYQTLTAHLTELPLSVSMSKPFLSKIGWLQDAIINFPFIEMLNCISNYPTLWIIT